MDEATTQDRIDALSKHLGIKPNEVTECGMNCFETDFGGRYTVLTDDEATEIASSEIENSLWAFKAEFLAEQAGLPAEAAEMIKAFCEEKCEDANDTIRGLIKDMDAFCVEVVSLDGRGHFLSHYDHSEREVDGLFIYCEDKANVTAAKASELEDKRKEPTIAAHTCEAVNLAIFGPVKLCCKHCGKDM